MGRLIDDHLISLGIDQGIAPVSILDGDFDTEIRRHQSDRAKASEMEHALRYRIRKHFDEDPAHFQKLRERLNHILETFKGEWELQFEAMKELGEREREGQEHDEYGLDAKTQRPFLNALREEMKASEISVEQREKLAEITVELVEHVRQEIARVNFWQNEYAPTTLRNWILTYLDDKNLVPFGIWGVTTGFWWSRSRTER